MLVVIVMLLIGHPVLLKGMLIGGHVTLVNIPDMTSVPYIGHAMLIL